MFAKDDPKSVEGAMVNSGEARRYKVDIVSATCENHTYFLRREYGDRLTRKWGDWYAIHYIVQQFSRSTKQYKKINQHGQRKNP